MKIIDITSRFGKIFITHRNNGKKEVKIVKDYPWYFYVNTIDLPKMKNVSRLINKSVKCGDYTKLFCDNHSINKFDLEKGRIDNRNIIVRHLVDNKIASYEADFDLWKRYLIDEPIDIDPDPLIGFFDIETDDSKNGIEIGRDQILSFAFNIKGKSYFYCDDSERKVLLKIKAFFEHVDIVCGWNSTTFDIPYVLARFAVHGIEFYKSNIIHFDLMEIFKKRFKFAGETPITNFNLEYISQNFLGKGKIQHLESIKWLYDNDRIRLGEYNKQDVQLLYELEEKTNLLRSIISVCVESHTPFRYSYTSELVDNYILQEAKKHNKILNSNMWKLENRNGPSEKKKFEGAIVFEPIVGLHENVTVLDYNSMYPNVMITFNIGIDTYLGKTKPNNDDWILTPNGCYFLKSQKSIVAIVCEKLLKERKDIKEEMKKFDKNSIVYKTLDSKQDAVKVLTNSVYGSIGSEFTRYFEHECAEAITLTSQYILKWSHKWFTLNEMMVTFGDSDSLGVSNFRK